MVSRRWSVLGALMLTAGLLWMLPGLWQSLAPPDTNRMDERLRPARLRTLTVWMMKEDVGDGKLLRAACSAFEKANDGVRVFLRTVHAEELYAQDTVLPDVILFCTGEIAAPEMLLPLMESHVSGMYAGKSLAVPLWLSPNVLSLPLDWFGESAARTPVPQSLLAHATPVPQKERSTVLSADQLPWEQLLSADGLILPQGVALQQLLSSCPQALRASLSAHSPTSSARAKAEPLAQYQKRLQNGEALCAFPLAPAVSDRVRYAALCRNGEDARAFVHFLAQEWQPEALGFGLLPLHTAPSSADPLLSALEGRFAQSVTLPNAFAHTREELNALCLDAFLRTADPVETLLRLR